MDSGAMSHMINLEDNMKNLKEAETQVIVEDSIILTGTKRGDLYCCRIHDRKLHCIKLSNTAAIPGLYNHFLL